MDNDEETPEPGLQSSSESDSESDDEESDSSFAPAEDLDDSEYEPCPATSRGAVRGSARGSSRGRKGQRETARSRSPLRPAAEGDTSQPWKTEDDPDVPPAVSSFQPRRTPGLQLDTTAEYSARDLFCFFFSMDTVITLCSNTNKNAARNKELGKKYQWTDVGAEDLYSFFGLLIYFSSLVSLPSVNDYWKHGHIFSVPFPKKVMSRDRFRSIYWNIHPSDPEENAVNDQRKGTPEHDKLFRVRPLYDDILTACQTHFHPRREVAIKVKAGMSQYMKDTHTKRDRKLFVLVESCSGYIVWFSIYKKKVTIRTKQGFFYDLVMSLVKESTIGTGYHIYMDDFYTSPKLLLDLFGMGHGACGTYQENTKGCPTERRNALTKWSERGAVRWIRVGPLLFVKWKDAREVSLCTTIHSAYTGDTVQRRVKEDGRWATRDIPCPAPVVAYSKNMDGIELSNQLVQYFFPHHRTGRWHKTIVLHFIDIATTNAFIMHRELCSTRGVPHKTHKDFMVELVGQLCKIEYSDIPQQRSNSHVPVPIIQGTTTKRTGRLRCKRCLDLHQIRIDTPWKCKACDVPLCIKHTRNCFELWHE